MSTEVYWFSGTGNSLHAARRIAEGLGDSELVPIAGSVGGVEALPERLGLVFPVYAWGPPSIVADFIEEMPAGSPEYVFAVATCGASAGSAMSITRRLLKKRGISLDAELTVKMVGNYPPMGGAPGPEKAGKRLEEAEKDLDAVVGRLKDGFRGRQGGTNPFFRVLGRVVYPLFRKHVSDSAGRFAADDRCTSCGICVRLCPVSNIELGEDGRPVWGDRCQQCYACFHWCPEEAVQYGRKTADQNRYHHPGVSQDDMLEQGGGA
ncbi:MAG: hypothetical protein AVO35_03690 [Candidatus Aegiribacteria sp. MLS_C]|nr:MAG: hypothetical protein AVO35_03690 [Candidatus Aegiribacteria sp. MLS_C]